MFFISVAKHQFGQWCLEMTERAAWVHVPVDSGRPFLMPWKESSASCLQCEHPLTMNQQPQQGSSSGLGTHHSKASSTAGDQVAMGSCSQEISDYYRPKWVAHQGK